MNINNNFVIERYKNKSRLSSYVARTKDGLYKEEEILIKKYLTPYSKILVVGCGTGREIYGLKSLGFKDITVVDISQDMIQEAKKLIKDVEFFVKDINKFESEEKFDAIIYFNNLVEQIPSFNERKKAILKAKELLNPNGLIFLATHSCFAFQKTIFELIPKFFKQFLYKIGIKKESPFAYIDEKEKIYANYSNPFTIKKILRQCFNLKMVNSKKYILHGKRPLFIYFFDEPVYYVGSLKS